MPAYPRQNALARALREIGCLERTLFILDWISDPALRRRSNAGLDGTKLRAIWDGSRPERAVGIQPDPRHRLEAYATLLTGVSSALSKCFLRGVPRAHSHRATVLV